MTKIADTILAQGATEVERLEKWYGCDSKTFLHVNGKPTRKPKSDGPGFVAARKLEAGFRSLAGRLARLTG